MWGHLTNERVTLCGYVYEEPRTITVKSEFGERKLTVFILKHKKPFTPTKGETVICYITKPVSPEMKALLTRNLYIYVSGTVRVLKDGNITMILESLCKMPSEQPEE